MFNPAAAKKKKKYIYIRQNDVLLSIALNIILGVALLIQLFPYKV